MADNRVVVYKGPGEVAVEDIEYPKLEVPEEVASAMGMTKEAPHAVDTQDRLDQHLRLGPAHGARKDDGPCRADAGARDHGRGHREGQRRPVHRHRRHLLGAFQHRLRPLQELQGAQDRRLPERQSRSRGLGLRLRGHGRLGRRAGRVRDGPLRGLQPAQVPGQGAGDGEDPGPHHALGHLPHRLPRLLHGGRDARARRSTSRARVRSGSRRPTRPSSSGRRS